MALLFNRSPQQRGECLLVLLKNEVVGARNALKRAAGFDWQKQRIIETAGPLQDGAAAGTAAQDGDGMLAAKGDIDFRVDCISVTDDDKILNGFPKTENAFSTAILAKVEQSLIAS